LYFSAFRRHNKTTKTLRRRPKKRNSKLIGRVISNHAALLYATLLQNKFTLPPVTLKIWFSQCALQLTSNYDNLISANFEWSSFAYCPLSRIVNPIFDGPISPRSFASRVNKYGDQRSRPEVNIIYVIGEPFRILWLYFRIEGLHDRRRYTTNLFCSLFALFPFATHARGANSVPFKDNNCYNVVSGLRSIKYAV